MRYKSVYSISFDALGDDEARDVAETHQRELWDVLRVEGADHPLGFALENVLRVDSEGTRALPEARTSIRIE